MLYQHIQVLYQRIQVLYQRIQVLYQRIQVLYQCIQVLYQHIQVLYLHVKKWHPKGVAKSVTATPHQCLHSSLLVQWQHLKCFLHTYGTTATLLGCYANTVMVLTHIEGVASECYSYPATMLARVFECEL